MLQLLCMAAMLRRLARDEAWTKAIVQANHGEIASPTKYLTYRDSEDFECYGALFDGAAPNKKKGIVLYHTAAGSRDMFLHWKADDLAREGYTVLIADLYGDELGKAWEDQEWTADRRKQLADHRVARRRSRAAIDAIEALGCEKIAAFGWCLGGRLILEMLKDGEDRLKCACSFHGVFDPSTPMTPRWPSHTRLLAFHGDLDPFVPGLDDVRQQLRRENALFDILVFAGAKHGFTNPGQSLNERPEFDFDPRAARISWDLAKNLLEDEMSLAE